MASEETKAALREELKLSSDQGAGLVELLDQVQTSNRRLGRRSRLSREQVDELSLYCWTLQSSQPNRLVWDRSSDLWGSMRTNAPTRRRRSA
jgi:hypothetical protein